MATTIGVVDEQPYPGPPNGAEYLAWSDAMADIARAVKTYRFTVGDALRQISEAYEANMRGIVEYIGIHGEADIIVPDPVAAKRTRNVGPRSGTTFGRNGRRNY